MYNHLHVERLIDLWLAEDVGHGDLTTTLMIDPAADAHFVVNAREPMVVAAIEVMAQVFRRWEPRLTVTVLRPDGTRVPPGEPLAHVHGPAQGILTAERTALNIVQRMSGIATETARYVAEIGDARARLVDTRKTTPGLRMLEKHAVMCGGGNNHRLGLDGGVLLKDNHIAVCGSIAAAVERARAAVPILTRIEVECDRLAAGGRGAGGRRRPDPARQHAARRHAGRGAAGRRAGAAGGVGRRAVRAGSSDRRNRGRLHLLRPADPGQPCHRYRARRPMKRP